MLYTGQQMTTVRAFLALDLDAEGQARLTAHLRRLRAAPWADQVRWVSPQHLHLTLRFLGEVTPAQATRYANAFRSGLAALRDAGALRLHASEPRLFPNPHRPRIIACLVEAHPTLHALVALAESCALDIGLRPETRPFQGHITLGRLRAWPIAGQLPRAESPGVLLQPDTITLYRSQLHPSGPTYSTLARFSLASQV